MKEEFLHFVWQHQLFCGQNLKCSQGKYLEIISQGELNSNSGPDFHTGRIKVGKDEWVGNIELHIHASEWELHGHQFDSAYDNVILHVVFEEDKSIKSSQGELITCLELKHRIDPSSVQRYDKLKESAQWIPCQQKLPFVEKKVIVDVIHNMLITRFERKANEIASLLEINQFNWEEVLYVTLAKNFGFKVNALPFSLLAKTVSYHQVRKYQFNPFLIECLLFGQAGLLDQDFKDIYPKSLKKEFDHQKNKLRLTPFPRSVWKNSKMRPNNFPALRIAQLAALLANENQLLDLLNENINIDDLKRRFGTIRVHPYWQTHSNFDKDIPERTASLGVKAIDTLLINTIVPFIFLKAKELKDDSLKEHAIRLLKQLKPEMNGIMRKWQGIGVKVRSAADSQALLELKNEQCSRKKCVSCPIGIKLIKPN